MPAHYTELLPEDESEVQRDRRENRRGLLFLNGFAFFVHCVCIALAFVLLDTNWGPSVPCIINFFEFATEASVFGGSLFIPTPKELFRVKVLLGLLLFEIVTAAFHIVYMLFLWYDSWWEWLHSRVGGRSINPLRWVEYSVSTSLMVCMGNLDIGITDFYFFLKTIASIVAIMIVGHIIELLDSRDPLQKRVANIVWTQATLLNLVSISILLTQVFGSKTHTNVFLMNVVPLALLFQTFGVVSMCSFMRSGRFRSPAHTEAWYLVLSLTTKVAVFWIGFATFRGIIEDRGFAGKTAGVNWDAVRWFFSVGPLVFIALLAVAEWFMRNAPQPIGTAVVKKYFRRKQQSLVF